MAIPVQTPSAADIGLTGHETDSTGEVDLSTWSADRRRTRLTIIVTGGTANFTLKGGQDASRLGVIATSSSVGSGGVVLYDDQGPYPALKLSWASNTGTITVDAQVWDAL